MEMWNGVGAGVSKQLKKNETSKSRSNDGWKSRMDDISKSSMYVVLKSKTDDSRGQTVVVKDWE